MLLREVAAAVSRDIGVVSRWETGDRTPKPEQVAQILTKLGVEGNRYDEIMTLAYGTNESLWVATTLPEQRQQMVAYIDWEQNATSIVEVAPLLIPGLLQTTEYIQAIMTGGGVLPGEIAARVASRIGRREIITKNRPADLLVLLGHAALRQDIGGKQVTLEQMKHLLDMAKRPNITLRIMPDHGGWHPGLEGAFSCIKSKATPARPAASIVFVGTRRSVLMLHEDNDVAAYENAIQMIIQKSLPPETSLALIADFAERLER
ncbi:hypothetical protein JOF56_001198 [Kibdelosporangium banguiense]|uniref:DUF5753 domain-containing protein n=1 Tax=Kibdelosporangium banguiense TaxID=1365924 RepID=A0ABS4TAB9_9PSEU|nr:hypothetical protein [Kibdelosporangium banguiense]